jgi:hypothetical protein
MKILLRFFLLYPFLSLFLFFTDADCAQISKEEVSKIANKVAKDLGYDVENMILKADEKNTEWKEYVAYIKGMPPAFEAKLKDRVYWAVYFQPIPDPDPNIVLVGGDLWVFIDANTGEVITHIKGA